jgi:hypothetical protein
MVDLATPASLAAFPRVSITAAQPFAPEETHHRTKASLHQGDMKGIIHEPSTKPTMKPESRDALLTAIAKARGWIDDIRLGRIASFAGIAEREAVGERHIRLLAPLAFLSPRIIAAIADGTAPADLTVTGLAKALPYSWAEQERATLQNT